MKSILLTMKIIYSRQNTGNNNIVHVRNNVNQKLPVDKTACATPT